MKNETKTISATITRETEKALLVSYRDGETTNFKTEWLPKSQVTALIGNGRIVTPYETYHKAEIFQIEMTGWIYSQKNFPKSVEVN